jgi:hypothetical protein
MAQVLKMRWEGVKPEHYEALRPIVRWESDPPEGLVFHVAWFRDGGITLVDVWESSALEGQPQTKWFEAHAYFNPAVPVTATV